MNESYPELSIEIADRFRSRLRGLLARHGWPPDRALWLIPCRAIHSFGMRVPIDAVFIARDGRIVQVRRSMAPGRIAFCSSAYSVVELAAGVAAQAGFEPGKRQPQFAAPTRRAAR